METKYRLLVVDDEETLCEALRFYLSSLGYDVDVAFSAEQALTLDLAAYNLFLLDIMMGHISGSQLASIIKSNPSTANTPVIFLTAKDSEDDVIAGLDLGADDYIKKPYSLKEVAARVRTVLRRADASQAAAVEPPAEQIAFEGLRVIPGKKLCMADGTEIRLPRKEFEILLTLLSRRNHVFSREELLRRVWEEEVVVLDRVIDVYINHIRRKIGRYGANIVTRSGYGYGFME